MNAAYAVAWLIAAALVAVGLYALLAPHPLARRYGVHINDEAAAGFVRATGVRDVALGSALGAAAYFRAVPLLVVIAGAGIVVSIADFLIAYHHGREKRFHAAHGIHAAGIVAFALAIAMALFAIGK
ncbi:MAG TPA: DUF4267 domain-containing protein [Candidatus Acidoferrales bacterium]|nr:DUF4267 domain-containing protein [Candidatus Acidoferrales bacterium]